LPGETIIVAGENFGLGSSREQAPLVIKESGIVCVVAKSFARIFYRNSFNIGLALVEADTDKIDNHDALEINLEESKLRDATKNITLKINPIPEIMRKLLADGGLVAHFKKYQGIKL
jgi:3-isopropylmalate/(R)-2-methylmalate dehydratase small subunit